MLFSHPKRKLGIDIGTSSIKLVQLRKENETYFLETYGIVNVTYQTAPGVSFDVLNETAQILQKLLAKTGATTKKAVASLPNNIVFVSVIEMPAMNEKELKSAVEWEARRYVPLPLEEVTLSWSVLKDPLTPTQLKVLLTAVPTTVIDNYLRMFKLADLEPVALEIEALALIRALVGPKTESFIIIDIGARNTSLNLVDKGFLRVSRNIAVGGETVTNAIAQSLRISYSRAEQFKHDLGLSVSSRELPSAMRPIIEGIKNEALQLIKMYESTGGTIQEIIFAGSGAAIPGLAEYFSSIGVKVSLGDPLKFVTYPEELRLNLSRVSLGLSVAMGLAMRE
jgi:type IV pilus assembly protein PilM